MQNNSDIQLESLSPKEKRRIERNLISLITGKTTKGDCSYIGNKKEAYLRIYNNHKNIAVYYGPCKASCDDCPNCDPIYFSKIPQKVELLLGVIYRPMFELYKETLNAKSK